MRLAKGPGLDCQDYLRCESRNGVGRFGQRPVGREAQAATTQNADQRGVDGSNEECRGDVGEQAGEPMEMRAFTFRGAE